MSEPASRLSGKSDNTMTAAVGTLVQESDASAGQLRLGGRTPGPLFR